MLAAGHAGTPGTAGAESPTAVGAVATDVVDATLVVEAARGSEAAGASGEEPAAGLAVGASRSRSFACAPK